MAMRPPTIAIADDDPAFAAYLSTFLESRGYQARVYARGEALLTAAHLGELPDVVLLDVMMPGIDGIATLRSLKAAHADLQVIMLSGREHAATIVEALSLGAVNYVVKPDDPGGLGEIALEAAIKQAMEKRQLVTEVAELRRRVNDDQDRAFLFTEHNETMRRIGRIIDSVADNDVTVLIRGESGVGKELVARAIHDRSVRRARPFVKVNCAALPDDLLESELFGHEKGAFTGAAMLRVGKFEHAAEGTLMLDEIGEMKASLQGKLLHVLQDGEFTRLGSNRRITAHARVVAATNCDLESMMARLTFREDLYYRLKVIEIVVPPLRERQDEIHRLVEFFIAKYAKRYNRPEPALTPLLLDAMQSYQWPGNIRELENAMKRFVILQDATLLLSELRPVERRAPTWTASTGVHPGAAIASAQAVASPAPVAERQAVPEIAAAGLAVDARPAGLSEVTRVAMQRAERELIVPTLQRVRWNRRKAAPLLGISYKTLLNKIKEHGIEQE